MVVGSAVVVGSSVTTGASVSGGTESVVGTSVDSVTTLVVVPPMAIALPAYKDYVIRGAVTDAITGFFILAMV